MPKPGYRSITIEEIKAWCARLKSDEELLTALYLLLIRWEELTDYHNLDFREKDTMSNCASELRGVLKQFNR
jgi:hypothetical protein